MENVPSPVSFARRASGPGAAISGKMLQKNKIEKVQTFVNRGRMSIFPLKVGDPNTFYAASV
jgi:hypothetical protein